MPNWVCSPKMTFVYGKHLNINNKKSENVHFIPLRKLTLKTKYGQVKMTDIGIKNQTDLFEFNELNSVLLME